MEFIIEPIVTEAATQLTEKLNRCFARSQQIPDQGYG